MADPKKIVDEIAARGQEALAGYIRQEPLDYNTEANIYQDVEAILPPGCQYSIVVYSDLETRTVNVMVNVTLPDDPIVEITYPFDGLFEA